MTLYEAYEKLQELVIAGYGERKLGYFSHHTGDFIECQEVRPTKNGGYYEEPGTEKTEEVIQISA